MDVHTTYPNLLISLQPGCRGTCELYQPFKSKTVTIPLPSSSTPRHINITSVLSVGGAKCALIRTEINRVLTGSM